MEYRFELSFAGHTIRVTLDEIVSVTIQKSGWVVVWYDVPLDLDSPFEWRNSITGKRDMFRRYLDEYYGTPELARAEVDRIQAQLEAAKVEGDRLVSEAEGKAAWDSPVLYRLPLNAIRSPDTKYNDLVKRMDSMQEEIDLLKRLNENNST